MRGLSAASCVAGLTRRRIAPFAINEEFGIGVIVHGDSLSTIGSWMTNHTGSAARWSKQAVEINAISQT
jgi:hypothetical protein